MDEKERLFAVRAVVVENDVVLKCDEPLEQIREIRYCYHNTNRGALLYNADGFPMIPFRLECSI